MPSLQEHLAKQQPATSGIHEAMALHTEDVFDEFAGILPQKGKLLTVQVDFVKFIVSK